MYAFFAVLNKTYFIYIVFVIVPMSYETDM